MNNNYRLVIFDWEGTLADNDVLLPGIKELLQKLNEQDYLLAVATSRSRRSLSAALDKLQLHHFFASTRTADETFSKPHPQMILELLDELQVEPHQTLMVGDTEHDLQMAKNAGVDAVAVSCGLHTTETLLRKEPLACLDATKDLADWLGLE